MHILIRDELYKILAQKIIYIAAAFFLLLQMMQYFSDSSHTRAEIRQLHERMTTYGGAYSTESVDWANNIHATYEASDRPQQGSQPTPEQLELSLLNRVANEIRNLQSHLSYLARSHANLSAELSKQDQDQADRPGLQASLDNTSHLLSVERTVMLQEGWNKLLQYQSSVGYVFAAALIILGVAGIYTSESSQRMTALLLATQHGRLRLALAKCIAAALYAVIVIAFFALAVLAAHAYQYGMTNWQYPLYNLHNLYGQTDFKGAILQFFAMQQLYALGGCIALAWLIILLSALSKRTAIPVFVGAAIVMLPVTVVLLHLPTIPPIVALLSAFPYMELIQLDRLADDFYVRSFGQTRSFRHHALLLLCMYLVLPLALLLWRMQRKEAL